MVFFLCRRFPPLCDRLFLMLTVSPLMLLWLLLIRIWLFLMRTLLFLMLSAPSPCPPPTPHPPPCSPRPILTLDALLPCPTLSCARHERKQAIGEAPCTGSSFAASYWGNPIRVEKSHSVCSKLLGKSQQAIGEVRFVGCLLQQAIGEVPFLVSSFAA